VADDPEATVLVDMTSLLAEPPTPGATPGVPPQVVVADRYRLCGVLGQGGAAVVHEATDTRLERQVAVKLLRDSSRDQAERLRFVAEARLLGGLSHPHLVRVLDAGVDRSVPYLVLELVHGPTLAELMADPATEIAPVRLAELGAEVALALAHVHSVGIVHRDVKPGNVLVSPEGRAKLADFGIARLVDDTSHYTRTGHLVGTVAYVAPEQVAGEPATPAVDVYALGLVLLEGLTGARAYAGTSVESALARLSRQPDIPPSLPPGWRPLLVAMTARDPQRRPTAAQVADRLRALASEPPPAATTSVWLSRGVLVGLAAAFALLLAVAAWPGSPATPGAPAAASAKRSPVGADDDAGATPTTPPATTPSQSPVAEPLAAPAVQGQPAGHRPRASHHHRPRHHHPGHHGKHHGKHKHHR